MGRIGSGVKWLAALTIFVAAAWLFGVQPMVAKMLLPRLGGAPVVWNTTVVFFQAALLLAYAYAHALTRIGRCGEGRAWWAVGVHAAVLALPLLVLPIAVRGAASADEPVAWWLLLTLTTAVGLPTLAIAATSPLVQHWMALGRGGRGTGEAAYRLYIASNAGSLVGLAAYPLLIEPSLTLTQQTRLWSWGYGGCALLTLVVCVLRNRPWAPRAVEEASVSAVALAGPIEWRTRGRWVLLAAVPASLSLAVTTHLTTDLAAFPLLWVVPLAIYLVTFMVAFSRRGPRVGAAAGRLLPVLLLLVMLVTLMGAHEPAWIVALFHLAALASGGLALHAELAESKPAAARLTEFYLWLALGGVLGSAFNSFVAPAVFSGTTEYPLALAAACALAATRAARFSRGLVVALLAPVAALIVLAWAWPAALQSTMAGSASFGSRLLLAGVPTLLAYTLMRRPVWLAAAVMLALGAHGVLLTRADLYRDRTVFGLHRVAMIDGRRTLLHGSTVHGSQWPDAARRGIPLAYYHPTGPIGQVFAALGPRARNIALVGLGTGALAAYGGPGATIDLYEIDGSVVRIAQNPRLFTFLSDSPATQRVFLGDGRLRLREAADAAYDVIVIDAFSSDAIPVHLLTREAVAEYLVKLAPGGVLALHLSNRHLDLVPVAAGIVGSLGLHARLGDDTDVPQALLEEGKQPSTWVVVARDEADLAAWSAPPMWRGIWRGMRRGLVPRGVVWTDDFSNILRVWRR